MKVWLLSVFLLLSACGGSSLQPLESGDVIVAFGDSLTSGKGVSEDNAYPAVLSELIGRQVVNAGISGETTEEGLARLPSVLDETNPSLLILFEGGNDILHDSDLTLTKSNLNAMINIAQEQGVPVVLVGVPAKNVFSNTAGLYTELAEEHELPFEAQIVAKLLRNPKMKSDRVHFNVDGYRALAEAIQATLVEAGAI